MDKKKGLNSTRNAQCKSIGPIDERMKEDKIHRYELENLKR